MRVDRTAWLLLLFLVAVCLMCWGPVVAAEPSGDDWNVWRSEVDARFDEVDARFDRIDARFDEVVDLLAGKDAGERISDESPGAAGATMGLTQSQLIALWRDCPECREAAKAGLDALGVEPALYQTPVAPKTATRQVWKTIREPCATCPSGYRLARRLVTETVPAGGGDCACGCGIEGCDCAAGTMLAAGEVCPDCGRADCPEWLASLGAAAGEVAASYSSGRFGASRFEGTRMQFQAGQPVRNAGRAVLRVMTAPIRALRR